MGLLKQKNRIRLSHQEIFWNSNDLTTTKWMTYEEKLLWSDEKSKKKIVMMMLTCIGEGKKDWKYIKGEK